MKSHNLLDFVFANCEYSIASGWSIVAVVDAVVREDEIVCGIGAKLRNSTEFEVRLIANTDRSGLNLIDCIAPLSSRRNE